MLQEAQRNSFLRKNRRRNVLSKRENIKRGCSPEPHNELVGPQQAEEVVNEQVLKLLVPVSVIVTAGIVSAASI